MDVSGKTLGIIGYGQIGQKVAKKAYHGLDMKVCVYKRNIKERFEQDGILFTNQMDEVIKQSDVLSLHVPFTSSNDHLIGKRELALMKNNAYFINTCRGEVVDEKALTTLLSDHKIAGAALDVFDGGVPDMDNPLLHMKHVIVTPHTAAFTTQSLECMSEQAARGIIEVLEAYPLTHPVNQIQKESLNYCHYIA